MNTLSRTCRLFAAVAILADPASEQLARRVAKALLRENVPHVTVRAAAAIPDDAKIVAVPNAVDLPPADVRRLDDFVADGGKLILYYCANPVLARAFDLVPGSWRGDRAFHAIAPEDKSLAPYPHRTQNVITPRARFNSAATVDARFYAAGARSAGPAVTINPAAGAWFSHIPPLTTPAAARHLANIITRLDPSLGGGAPPPMPLTPVRPPDFIGLKLRAAWLPEPPGFAGGLDALPAWMKARGLNAVFAAPEALGDPALRARAVAAAARDGIAIHLWVNAFERAADGRTWSVPRSDAARAARVRTLLASVPAGAAGVQLDYVRANDADPATPELTEDISRFVRDFAAAFRAARPGAALSAAVFPTPVSCAARAQDWPRWIREGWIDFVSPMIYTENAETFAASLAQCRDAAPGAKLVPGIAACADEAAVDRAAARAQVAAAHRLDCHGVSFFALDWALAELCAPRAAPATTSSSGGSHVR